MGEREKGHEWRPLDGHQCCECGWKCGGRETGGTTESDCKRAHETHLASLEAQPEPPYVDAGHAGRNYEEPIAAHPSAGRGDASLSQLLNAMIEAGCTCDVMYGSTCSIHSKVYAVAEFVRTRLAESRAAMREEAAKVADSHIKSHPHHFGDGTAEHVNWSPCAFRISTEIRSLPANSSALDARDARVSEEALKGLDDLIAKWRADVSDVTVDSGWMVGARPKTASMKAACADQLERFVLAQRSAEKGK